VGPDFVLQNKRKHVRHVRRKYRQNVSVKRDSFSVSVSKKARCKMGEWTDEKGEHKNTKKHCVTVQWRARKSHSHIVVQSAVSITAF